MAIRILLGTVISKRWQVARPRVMLPVALHNRQCGAFVQNEKVCALCGTAHGARSETRRGSERRMDSAVPMFLLENS